MESNYNNESFERFLRESSDQYRMYPSENAWKKIYNALHTRRRWFGIGLILLLSAGFVTTIMLTNSSTGSSHQLATKNTQPATEKIKEQAESTEADNSPLTTYSGNLKKERSSILQPLILSADKSSTTTVNAIEPAVENPVKEISLETIDNKKPENTTAPVLVNEQTENNSAVYSPVLINITDQLTDQDYSWVLKNSNFINSDRPRKDVYRLNGSSNKPLTIESVINSYTRRNKKLSFQYYFTPTISYRKLSENKSYLRSINSGGTSGTTLYTNINNVVTHKPDMGLEVGVAARYALNKKLKVRGGVQFNTSRYDIKAFNYASELTTIALNTGPTVDSVNTISNYRNFNGYKSDWLHNFYFQISVPVGIELKLAGDDKIQFGIASTIQPTYIIGDRAYLLSSNYKNYAEVPWLIRRWNMNTSLEAFVSYSTGKMNWQIGPQVRYQLYSSFVKEYPVKENLFDFGLKVAVSANR